MLVYIVDDESLVRDSVGRLLTASGIESVGCESAKEFLAASDRTIRGCALFDLQMPEMDGFELFKETRRRGYSLPVIFLTGHGDIEKAVEAIKAGVLDFIEKPFEADKLLRCVRRALDHDLAQSVSLERYSHLTPREREVVGLICEGLTTKAIAAQLGISAHTVRNQRTSIFRKMGVPSAVDLVRLMATLQLPDPAPDSE